MKRYCVLNLHKDNVFMCIIDEFVFKKEHKFSTLISDLLLFREGLFDSEVHYIVMEARVFTGSSFGGYLLTILMSN